ncbi:15862_t:CDS:1 [Cetraspora pellucida]|uniref:15862_t:CDS:1 n=1 Tax=Cetraspora pellucida TaxID=1433469 RepID=A0ACA9M1Y7_9GLOM|nr:15862_t:CDS:1 [Cetraspora pellucida]
MSQRSRLENVPIFAPFPQTNISIPNDDLVNQIIASIDPTILLKIRQYTYLEIKDLIAPKPKKNRSRQKIPRPQNPFVIFRRNEQAKMLSGLDPKMKESMLAFVSKAAGKDWKTANVEVKNVFNYLAQLAKKVHEETYPDYVYQPRKKVDRSSFQNSAVRNGYFINSPVPEFQSPPDYSDFWPEGQHSSYANNYHSNSTSSDKNRDVWSDSLFPCSHLPSKHLPSIWSLVDSATPNAQKSTILPCSSTFAHSTLSTTLSNYQPEMRSSLFKPLSIYSGSPTLDPSGSNRTLPPLEVDISNYTTDYYDRNLLTSLLV